MGQIGWIETAQEKSVPGNSSKHERGEEKEKAEEER